MQNYVQTREAEIKARYRAEMWWLGFANLFKKLGETIRIKREADYYSDEFNKIRSQYVKRGRKPGTAYAT